MKNITTPQAIVLVACIAAPIAAYKWLGSPEAAGASMVVGMILNFLLGRNDGGGNGGSGTPVPDTSETTLRVLPGGKGLLSALGLALVLIGCAPQPKSVVDVCVEKAKESYDDGATPYELEMEFRRCLQENGQ